MSLYRELENIYKAGPTHMVGDGFRVINFIPGDSDLAKRLNPFVLLDYNPSFYFPPTDSPFGVGPHPHRGFETVTIAYKGAVAHHDSDGNHGIIEAGDVQWMTAGSGILHKEYHATHFAKQGGLLQMVQLWVNLPALYKNTPPAYQALTKQQMGLYHFSNQQGLLRIIAGNYDGVHGPAKTFTPINLFDMRLLAQSEAILELPSDHNVAILVLEGEITINQNQSAHENQLLVFSLSAGKIKINSEEKNAILLVLSAEPLLEPIAHYGPFVMNTREELQHAFIDFYQGKFGDLE
ncbi:TPA: pirin family protein [Legionella pneumophila]